MPFLRPIIAILLLLAQAMQMTQATAYGADGGSGIKAMPSCCEPGQCGCCFGEGGDTKLPEPVAPVGRNVSAPKVIPVIVGMVAPPVPAFTGCTRALWRVLAEQCSSGEVSLSVLHCSFLI
jgi:hypothetical protein